MSRDMPLAEALWIYTAERVREIESRLQNITVEAPEELENPYIDRRSHVDEFMKMAHSHVADAVELIEDDDDLHHRPQAVEQLMSSVDVFLEATQDALVRAGVEGPTVESIAGIRELVQGTEQLARMVTQEIEE